MIVKSALFLFFVGELCCEQIDKPNKEEAKPNKESFSYIRVGGYTVIYIVPNGGEVAIGHRVRNRKFAYGHMVNISAGSLALPAISYKFEGLYYPAGCKGLYLGLMPGIGIARGNINFCCSSSHRGEWYSFINLELVAGKEFLNRYKKKQFFYASFNIPCLGFSLNYGWGF